MINRRSFLLHGAITCAAIPLLAGRGADAARLSVSTVTVNVLSVVQVSRHTDKTLAPGDQSVIETTKYVAKARIVEVPHNEHNLSPGVIIDIQYRTVVRTPTHPAFRLNTRTLVEGETVTLPVFGGGIFFTWRT